MKNFRALSLPKKISFILLVCLVIYTITGFFIAPPVINYLLEKNLTETLHRKVTIRKVKLNPYALTATIQGLAVEERESADTFISCNELHVNLEIASAFKRGLVLKEARLSSPYVRIVRNDDATYNFSDLLSESSTDTAAEPAEPFRFAVSNIELIDGSINFQDGPMQKTHKAGDLSIIIPMISNFPDYIETDVQTSFNAVINGSPISLTGTARPFSNSLETGVSLHVKDMDIKHYLAYVPVRLNFIIESGQLGAETTLSFRQLNDNSSSLILEGNISLREFKAVDMNRDPLIALPSVDLSIARSDLLKGELHLAGLTVRSPEIHVKRDREGSLNMQSLVVSEEKQDQGGADAQGAESAEDSGELVLDADRIVINEGTLLFSDASLTKPFESRLNRIELALTDFSTARDRKGSVSLSFGLDKKGTVLLEGPLGINPLITDLELSLKQISIVLFQPYFTDKINIVLTGGEFSADGSLHFSDPDSGELDITYKGDAAVSGFSSVDRAGTDDFLKWESLTVDKLNFGYSPLIISIHEISLKDYYSRLIIYPDGTLNVAGIVKTEESGKESPPEPENSGPAQDDGKNLIKIDAVSFSGGTVNFSDRHITPSYSANMLDLGGRVSGLSSQEGTAAEVDLKGKLENHAPLEITGQINPLREDLFVDLKVSFMDMDLSPLTPYAGKFIGYTIQKGKLSLALQYLIENKKLDSKNDIFLDQFTLGEKVESPDATNLPVKLGLSLLRDRKGEIKLDLPVSGRIDDPAFSIGPIILKMLTNILVKAATSPFSLLGAIVGGGEELSYVEFHYGSVTINTQGEKKLDTLIKALADRPSLNIDIEGYADTVKDREGLQRSAFDKNLKARKLKKLLEQGGDAAAAGEIPIGPEEYDALLEEAYKEANLPVPDGALNSEGKLPAAEMEKQLISGIEISDSDLQQLASKRALNVKNYVLQSGQIEPKRVFMIKPKSLDPEKKKKIKNSRVDFKLK